MFKFSFVTEESGNDSALEDCLDGSKGNSDEGLAHDCQKIIPTNMVIENYEIYKLNSTTLRVKDVTISHVTSRYFLGTSSPGNEAIGKAEEVNSDLIPGVYEGGAKIWECTHDLLFYMSSNLDVSLRYKRVLDLGCGSGILGIYCYKMGARVQFQDYNREVLEKITIPNVLLNNPEPDSDSNHFKLESVEFYSGDWKNFAIFTQEDEKFDIILSSETIYNPKNQLKLLNTLHSKMKSSSIALIAAKTCYFGLGGSIRQFEDLIHKDERFTTAVVWESTGGVSREIIKLSLL